MCLLSEGASQKNTQLVPIMNSNQRCERQWYEQVMSPARVEVPPTRYGLVVLKKRVWLATTPTDVFIGSSSLVLLQPRRSCVQ